jgi:hypothetical protein
LTEVLEAEAAGAIEPTATWRDNLRAALPSWLAARGLMLTAWLAATYHRTANLDHLPTAMADGLYAWDGVFYRDIAAYGYRSEVSEAIRFFPLFALVARPLGWLIGAGPAVVLLANLFALLAGALLHRLVLHETGDRTLARRSAVALAIAPPAFVLALAYADAMFLALAIATFLCLRQRRWWLAAGLGMAAAATRPTGVVLAAAAAVEVGRPWALVGLARLRSARGPGAGATESVAPPGSGPLDLGGRLAAVTGPVAGAGAYLAWVHHRFGDWQIPLDIQDELRGGTVNPLVRLWNGLGDLVGFGDFRDGLHFPFALAIVVLGVMVARRLPASYALFTFGVAVVAIGAENLNSVERYGLNAFPIVIAAAWCTARRPAIAKVAAVVSASGFVALCTLAWLGEYVP